MRVTDLRVYPVKALDGTAVGTARITPGGTLAGDRTYALFGPRGDPINGKRTPLVHELDADLDQDSAVLAVAGDGETRRPSTSTRSARRPRRGSPTTSASRRRSRRSPRGSTA